jgi:hypothetical protein
MNDFKLESQYLQNHDAILEVFGPNFAILIEKKPMANRLWQKT